MTAFDSNTLIVLVCTLLGMLVVKRLIQMLTGPKLPPGPMPLPIIGNLHQLTSRPEHSHITFYELAKRYGDMVTVSIFNTKFVILNSHEMMKEVFVKNADAFSYRPLTYLLNIVSEGGKGLVLQAGDWKGMRRITAASLRDFGIGNKSMEWKILHESDALANVFNAYEGKPFDPSPIVTKASSNLICSVCFGSRFEYTDERFRSLTDRIVEIFKIFDFMQPLDFIPILRWFPLPAKVKRFLSNAKDIDNFIRGQIEDHRATFDKNNLRDFIDLYLDKEAEDSCENEFFSEPNIRNVIRDLFFAGTNTATTSFRWALIYMLHHPEIQARLGNEIQQVVGNQRQPSSADKTNLSYLQAFMMETLRHGSVGHTTLPHLCTADTQIGRHTIPKGATVIGNIYHIHMSERYWKNPTQFNPDRFLDDNGKLLNIKDGFIAFGAGPRQCIGETLAWSQLFLILACLIQKFTFKPVDGNNLPSLMGKAGVNLTPEPFKMCAIPK